MSEGIKSKFVNAWLFCQNPELDGKNPHFGNRYATLAATLGRVREACAGQGIAYIQSLETTEHGCVIRSSVIDTTGETLPLSTFPVEAQPNSQKFGSNLTYVKRQQAQADWGIVGDEDDDGEAAAGGITLRCSGCGAVFKFETKKQAETFVCPQCGGKQWVS